MRLLVVVIVGVSCRDCSHVKPSETTCNSASRLHLYAKERSQVNQESCAVARMTARCALYMGALKIFVTP